MTENEDRIQRVELDMKTAKKWQNNHKTLLNLEQLKGFKDLILEGYLKDEAVRLVGLKADQEMQSKDQQKWIDGSILAISNLRQYFLTVHKLGRTAEHTLKHDERTQQNLLASDLDGTN